MTARKAGLVRWQSATDAPFTFVEFSTTLRTPRPCSQVSAICRGGGGVGSFAAASRWIGGGCTGRALQDIGRGQEMTHNNHRQGSYESLCKDFTVFMYGANGFNLDGIGPKLQEFLRICANNGALNYGSSKAGNAFTKPLYQVSAGLSTAKNVYAVFDDHEKVTATLRDLVAADLGVSVIVSGLFDKVDESCKAAGLRRHTVEYSLGVWGRTDKLPEQPLLDINT